jgi:hypothetical protein
VAKWKVAQVEELPPTHVPEEIEDANEENTESDAENEETPADPESLF